MRRLSTTECTYLPTYHFSMISSGRTHFHQPKVRVKRVTVYVISCIKPFRVLNW